jgi:Tfp pilus assembly PilM family ATPase
MIKKEKISSFLGEEKIVGIDIDKDSVKVASAHLNEGGKVIIDQIGSLEYDPKSSDVEIASSIGRLWHKSHIKTHTVYSCLHSPSLMLKHFQYTNLDTKEIESALLLEAEQAFQKAPEDLFIDWHLYPSSSPASGKNGHIEGVLIAALTRDINQHLRILERAGLLPIAVDVGCMAIGNLFISLNGKLDKESVCLVNVSNYSADVAIISGDSYIYPSSIYSKEPLQEKIDYLVNCIVDVLRYHQFKLHKKPVKKVVLSGVLSKHPRLQDRLKEAVDSPVESWDPLEGSNVEISRSLDKKDIDGPAMAICLGLALRRE